MGSTFQSHFFSFPMGRRNKRLSSRKTREMVLNPDFRWAPQLHNHSLQRTLHPPPWTRNPHQHILAESTLVINECSKAFLTVKPALGTGDQYDMKLLKVQSVSLKISPADFSSYLEFPLRRVTSQGCSRKPCIETVKATAWTTIIMAPDGLSNMKRKKSVCNKNWFFMLFY